MSLAEPAPPLPPLPDSSATAPSYPHEPTVDPASVGINPRVLKATLDLFREQQRLGYFPGGQMVVRRHGKLVLDEALGFARGVDAGEGVPLTRVTPYTPFMVFSAGKPLIAVAIALLEERGLLDVHAPIAEVFPEFGRSGKQHITTLDVLTHRGGFPMPDFSRRHQDWGDWNKVLAAISAVQPTYSRGVLAYHPLEYGWALAEVVHRVSGLPFSEFLDREFTGPAELPALHFGVRSDDSVHLARPYWLARGAVYIGNVDISRLFREIALTPQVMSGFIPGAGLISDAASLASFYDVLLAGGLARNGKRLLQEATVRRYTQRHAFGWDRSNRAPLAVGRGFLLGTQGPSLYGLWNSSDTFGHAGAFCTVAFGDRQTGLSAAFVTNGNRGPSDLVRRFVRLAGTIRNAAQ